jgi:hypothetical protein
VSLDSFYIAELYAVGQERVKASAPRGTAARLYRNEFGMFRSRRLYTNIFRRSAAHIPAVKRTTITSGPIPLSTAFVLKFFLLLMTFPCPLDSIELLLPHPVARQSCLIGEC